MWYGILPLRHFLLSLKFFITFRDLLIHSFSITKITMHALDLQKNNIIKFNSFFNGI
jgi:hypothetical protein